MKILVALWTKLILLFKEKIMNFITNPIMKSFVGFDSLFSEFERLSTYKEQSYPAYNIEKISETDYKISLH